MFGYFVVFVFSAVVLLIWRKQGAWIWYKVEFSGLVLWVLGGFGGLVFWCFGFVFCLLYLGLFC